MRMIGHNLGGSNRLYAIVFDLDTESLRDLCHGNNYNNAYMDIRKYLTARGFEWMQGSTYFGNPDIDAVKCVTTVQKLARKFDWFTPCVRDIRMLRIEEDNDLSGAINLDDED